MANSGNHSRQTNSSFQRTEQTVSKMYSSKTTTSVEVQQAACLPTNATITTGLSKRELDLLLTHGWPQQTMYAPLPVKRLGWIGAFADLGAFGTPGGTEMAVNLGLGVRLGSVFGIYFPLYSTDNLMPVSGNYGERIRFTLKMNPMHKLNLRKLIN
jgi:hypothetical protein